MQKEERKKGKKMRLVSIAVSLFVARGKIGTRESTRSRTARFNRRRFNE